LIIIELRGVVSRALVMRGLDPRIHHFRKMDCRVKPGNDEEAFGITNALSTCSMRTAHRRTDRNQTA
jgi:hypothetical protein